MAMYSKFIIFKGKKYRLSGHYYRRENWGKSGPSTLHRAIWEHFNGDIPEGHEIHHKNSNTFDNCIYNLECLPGHIHQRDHALERIKQGKLKPPTQYALYKAAEWHGTKEGREWHGKHGKSTWEGREWHKCTCQNCGQAFNSPYPSRAKWCHPNCKAEALRKRKGWNVGVRPDRRKKRVLSGKRDIGE